MPPERKVCSAPQSRPSPPNSSAPSTLLAELKLWCPGGATAGPYGAASDTAVLPVRHARQLCLWTGEKRLWSSPPPPCTPLVLTPTPTEPPFRTSLPNTRSQGLPTQGPTQLPSHASQGAHPLPRLGRAALLLHRLPPEAMLLSQPQIPEGKSSSLPFSPASSKHTTVARIVSAP